MFNLFQRGVPPLVELCAEVIASHVDILESIQSIPEKYLHVILKDCPPYHLERLEKTSKVDTNEYWKEHCRKLLGIDVNSATYKQKKVDWRKMYFEELRKQNEKKRKFEEKAKQMMEAEEKAKNQKRIRMIEPPKQHSESPTRSRIRQSSSSSFQSSNGGRAIKSQTSPMSSLMKKSMKDLKADKVSGIGRK
jgi:hypothetical protein